MVFRGAAVKLSSRFLCGAMRQSQSFCRCLQVTPHVLLHQLFQGMCDCLCSDPDPCMLLQAWCWR